MAPARVPLELESVTWGPAGSVGPVILSRPLFMANPGVPLLAFVPASGVGAFQKKKKDERG